MSIHLIQIHWALVSFLLHFVEKKLTMQEILNMVTKKNERQVMVFPTGHCLLIPYILLLSGLFGPILSDRRMWCRVCLHQFFEFGCQ